MIERTSDRTLRKVPTMKGRAISIMIRSLLSLFNILPEGVMSKYSLMGAKNILSIILLWSFLEADTVLKDKVRERITIANAPTPPAMLT